MPSYKLTYFNGRGRAEATRLMFALAGVEFEDKRVNSDEWKELKPKAKFPILPSLEIDGKAFTQSRAIVTYLAKEFGFYSSNNMEALQIEEVLSIIEDFFQAAIKVMFAPEDKKEELAKDFKENGMPKFFGWLEKLLKANSSGYFVGDKLTVADVVGFDFISGLQTRHPGCTKDFPSVEALVEKVGGNSNIKAWIAKRPVTQF